MANQAVIKRRRDFLQEYLATHTDVDIDVDELNKEMASSTESKELSTSRFLAVVRGLGPPLPDGVLTVSKKGIRLDVRADFVIQQRRIKRPETKTMLGRAIWHLLLGVELPDSLEVDRYGWSDELTRRVERLPTLRSIAVYVDAGSTTEKVVESLDDVPSLFDTRARSMTPRLQVVTSSLGVANHLCRSRHRHDVLPFVVGGQLRPGYESMSGLITQKVLPYFEMSGSVAVLGATGLATADAAPPRLLCNDLGESFIKTSYLQGASELRMVVVDAEKLTRSEPHRSFATLDAVDLLVVDDGRLEADGTTFEQDVDAFREEAKRHGVALLVVGRAREEDAE